jgi:leucyl aminopeptidase
MKPLDAFVAPTDAVSPRTLRVIAGADYPAWCERQTPALRAWLEAQGISGVGGRWAVLPANDGAPGEVLAVVGDVADPQALAFLPRQLPAGDYALLLESALPLAQALLGWGWGAYRFERYLGPKPCARLCLPSREDAVEEVLTLVEAAHALRDWVNTPTEHLGPEQLEAEARALAKKHGAEFRSVVGEELLRENFPAIHAVGRASHRAPRLLELEWGDPAHPRVAIVGKGVCFDTGGLDIKTGEGMRNMKKDMGGAAHALALTQLVMQRRLPLRLQLLLPAVENAIGPNAYRPGEVIATRRGLSIEIDNTDAEGRVVLCDALAYAGERQPDLLLDFATLTGAARVALGPELPALYCNDEALAAQFLAASAGSGDPLWRMPLWRPYLGYLKSNVADLANAGASRMGGSISAALYLERFVPAGQRWAHLDLYSWNDSERPGRPAGGEPQGLRAAYELLKQRYC